MFVFFIVLCSISFVIAYTSKKKNGITCHFSAISFFFILCKHRCQDACVHVILFDIKSAVYQLCCQRVTPTLKSVLFIFYDTFSLALFLLQPWTRMKLINCFLSCIIIIDLTFPSPCLCCSSCELLLCLCYILVKPHYCSFISCVCCTSMPQQRDLIVMFLCVKSISSQFSTDFGSHFWSCTIVGLALYCDKKPILGTLLFICVWFYVGVCVLQCHFRNCSIEHVYYTKLHFLQVVVLSLKEARRVMHIM